MKDNPGEVKKPNWLMLTGLILIVAIIIFIIFLLNGHTTITGEFAGQKNAETLVCEGGGIPYPIFKNDNSNDKVLKINTIFENKKLVSISLIYRLNYGNEETMRNDEAFNHAAMNLSFYDDEMESDALEAKYSFLESSLQMSLYAKNDQLNQKSLKYFMLPNIYNIDGLTKEKMAEIYNEKGLNCEIKYNENKGGK